MGGINSLSQALFNEVLNSDGVTKYPNIPNPVKHLSDGTTIIYCIYKREIYECLIDTCDLDKVSNNITWVAHGRKNRSNIYTMSSCGPIHRLLMQPKDDEVVDHIDGNGLNNTRKNLRCITQSENMLNKRKYKNNKTGILNVTERDGYYSFYLQRRFYSKEIAELVSNEVAMILDKYSRIDIETRNK